jgi:hypothetical protein
MSECLPKTRKEARAAGNIHFFSGKSCKNGHVAKRLVSNYRCVVCSKEDGERHRKNDPERYRRMQYGWAERNPEKVKSAKRKHYGKKGDTYRAYARHYSNANPEKVSAANKAWYAKNAERRRENSRIKMAQWVKENLDRHRANQRANRARRKKAEGKHSAEDIRRIRASQGDCCVYCHIKLNGRGHIDHRQPLSRGGTNWPSNIQITCAKCNIAKRDHDPIDFARSLGKLF